MSKKSKKASIKEKWDIFKNRCEESRVFYMIVLIIIAIGYFFFFTYVADALMTDTILKLQHFTGH